MKPHPDIEEFNRLYPSLLELQELAKKHGVYDIFQDNGGKILQLLLLTGLRALPGRLGNDAIDDEGHEYELKTVNTLLSRSFTTHHHLNPTIIKKYREVSWIFAAYEGVVLRSVHLLTPQQMEFFYSRWEAKWYADGGKDINNPKIPIRYVLELGIPIYPF